MKKPQAGKSNKANSEESAGLTTLDLDEFEITEAEALALIRAGEAGYFALDASVKVGPLYSPLIPHNAHICVMVTGPAVRSWYRVDSKIVKIEPADILQQNSRVSVSGQFYVHLETEHHVVQQVLLQRESVARSMGAGPGRVPGPGPSGLGSDYGSDYNGDLGKAFGNPLGERGVRDIAVEHIPVRRPQPPAHHPGTSHQGVADSVPGTAPGSSG